MRTTLPFFAGGLALCLSAGCSHMVENRVVQAFAESLKDHDLAKMKAESSQDFTEKAVNGDETFRALKMIELPEGMPKVVNVKPIKDEKGKEVAKRVLATIGKDNRKVVFRLKPDGNSGRWVVDDLFLSKDDYENNRSVATRLGVLLSVQESLDAWKAGTRDQILAVATPEFAQSLSQLSSEQLSQFANKCTGEMPAETRILPDERINEEFAELRVARPPDGEIILKFRRDGLRWKLDDLALESRRSGDDIASARQVTSAMSAALRFEAAYRNSDKRALEQVCTRPFFEGSLAPADLTLVKLPKTGDGLDKFDIKLDGSMATLVVPAGSEVLKISLKQKAVDDEYHAVPRFQVDEVTIYDLGSRQDKRLSSLFTAQATMEAFGAALADGDIATLNNNSTHDFNLRVWDKEGIAAHLAALPTARTRAAKPQIVQTRFQGALTEILVEQGETPLTYVMREEGGRMLVDDVLIPSPGWPESLKTTAELLLPALNFAAGLRESRMDIVRGNSTADFSKFAWNHLDRTPDFEPAPESFFKTPLTSISLAAERADITFGNKRRGARFLLVKERGQFRVDDVTLVTGPGAEQQIPLKRTIRTQLARGDAR
jgi:hypothetical protein